MADLRSELSLMFVHASTRVLCECALAVIVSNTRLYVVMHSVLVYEDNYSRIQTVVHSFSLYGRPNADADG
jgi:hypothetical protein